MTAEAPAILDTPRSLRVRLGLTQEVLARRARIMVRTLSTLERGDAVGLSVVRRAAAVLGTSAGYLVDSMENERALRAARKAWPLRHARKERRDA